jgi:hypothetical protein
MFHEVPKPFENKIKTIIGNFFVHAAINVWHVANFVTTKLDIKVCPWVACLYM